MPRAPSTKLTKISEDDVLARWASLSPELRQASFTFADEVLVERMRAALSLSMIQHQASRLGGGNAMLPKRADPSLLISTFCIGQLSSRSGADVLVLSVDLQFVMCDDDLLDRCRIVLPDFLSPRAGRRQTPMERWKDLFSQESASVGACQQQLAKLIEQALWAMALEPALSPVDETSEELNYDDSASSAATASGKGKGKRIRSRRKALETLLESDFIDDTLFRTTSTSSTSADSSDTVVRPTSSTSADSSAAPCSEATQIEEEAETRRPSKTSSRGCDVDVENDRRPSTTSSSSKCSPMDAHMASMVSMDEEATDAVTNGCPHGVNGVNASHMHVEHDRATSSHHRRREDDAEEPDDVRYRPAAILRQHVHIDVEVDEISSDQCLGLGVFTDAIIDVTVARQRSSTEGCPRPPAAWLRLQSPSAIEQISGGGHYALAAVLREKHTFLDILEGEALMALSLRYPRRARTTSPVSTRL